uniref:Butyrophilin subfamily 1 member A1-like n=1 Tax=Pelusios castaneus TaxID=367368 RepID=A0A8C8SK62_9SAUR
MGTSLQPPGLGEGGEECQELWRSRVTMKMKLSSRSHGSRASVSLPHFVICFIILPIHNVQPAQFTVIGPGHPITAIVGEDIELPCHLSPTMSAENMDVRWFRSHLSSLVHRYCDGKDQIKSQMPEYVGRTEFVKDGIGDGSVALRLRNIRPSDEGQYTCYFQSTYFYHDAILELKVAGLGSAPLISVEGYQDGGIRVVCRSAGWYPEPQVFWRDLAGQYLPSVSETKFQRDNGLFETQTSIIVTESSNQNISCYIRSTVLRQEKEAAIYIAEPIFPKDSSWLPVLYTVPVILVFIIGTLIYFLKKQEKAAEECNKEAKECKMMTEELQKMAEEYRWRECLTEAVDVTLDPDTANPHLIISADQRSVRLEETDEEPPSDHEGFHYSPCVLGSQGFTSGRHYWGVEVGRKGGWAVGVARESVKEKGVVNLKPEDGVWAIERQWWGQFWALNNSTTRLSLRRKPEKIRVSLDYEEGLVEFFDADNDDPFFSFDSAAFAGATIRPFFRVGGAGAHLRLCPREKDKFHVDSLKHILTYLGNFYSIHKVHSSIPFPSQTSFRNIKKV